MRYGPIDPNRPRALVDMAVSMMGSVPALAAALQVDQTTVRRWYRGQSGLAGTALVAMMALIRHPEDFDRYKKEK